MTARERKASGGMSATATIPDGAHSPVHATGRNGAADPAGARPPRWEEWFLNASPSQGAEMLALAARQGILYANQIPPPVNGARAKSTPDDPIHLKTLARLLAGNVDDLAPVAVQPVT